LANSGLEDVAKLTQAWALVPLKSPSATPQKMTEPVASSDLDSWEKEAKHNVNVFFCDGSSKNPQKKQYLFQWRKTGDQESD